MSPSSAPFLSSASDFLSTAASWLYDHLNLSSGSIGKPLFLILPWLCLFYVHVVPDWVKPAHLLFSYGSGASYSMRASSLSYQSMMMQKSNTTTTTTTTRVQRMKKRLTMNVEKFKSPVQLASGITGVFQTFAKSIGFRHWIFFLLYHARFSLIVSLYARFETKRQHPDIFDRHRRRYGKPMDVQHLRNVMRNLEFAQLAYEEPQIVERELAVQGYTLLRHHLIVEPGMPAHYLAVNYHKRELLWGIRGTKSFSDVITDIVCAPKRHKLASPLLQDAEKEIDRRSILCHEGILAGAYQLTKEIQPLLEHVFLPQGYNLKICGHSLGGGVASCLGILLLSKIKTFQDDQSRLHVYAFAPPNCVGYTAAVAHAPIITSVVNNEDFITRFSFTNLTQLHHVLLKLQDRYRDWSPFTFLFWWTKKNQAKLTNAVMDYDDVEKMSTEFHAVDHENGMYVPGKIMYVWKLGFKDSHGGQLDGRETDARHPSLRFIQLSPNCIKDHLCDSYKEDFNSYVKQLLQEQAAASTGSAAAAAAESRRALLGESGRFIRSSGSSGSLRISSNSVAASSSSRNKRESARLIRNTPPSRSGSYDTKSGSDGDSVGTGGGGGGSTSRNRGRSSKSPVRQRHNDGYMRGSGGGSGNGRGRKDDASSRRRAFGSTQLLLSNKNNKQTTKNEGGGEIRGSMATFGSSRVLTSSKRGSDNSNDSNIIKDGGNSIGNFGSRRSLSPMPNRNSHASSSSRDSMGRKSGGRSLSPEQRNRNSNASSSSSRGSGRSLSPLRNSNSSRPSGILFGRDTSIRFSDISAASISSSTSSLAIRHSVIKDEQNTGNFGSRRSLTPNNSRRNIQGGSLRMIPTNHRSSTDRSRSGSPVPPPSREGYSRRDLSLKARNGSSKGSDLVPKDDDDDDTSSNSDGDNGNN